MQRLKNILKKIKYLFTENTVSRDISILRILIVVLGVILITSFLLNTSKDPAKLVIENEDMIVTKNEINDTYDVQLKSPDPDPNSEYYTRIHQFLLDELGEDYQEHTSLNINGAALGKTEQILEIEENNYDPEEVDEYMEEYNRSKELFEENPEHSE